MDPIDAAGNGSFDRQRGLPDIQRHNPRFRSERAGIRGCQSRPHLREDPIGTSERGCCIRKFSSERGHDHARAFQSRRVRHLDARYQSAAIRPPGAICDGIVSTDRFGRRFRWGLIDTQRNVLLSSGVEAEHGQDRDLADRPEWHVPPGHYECAGPEDTALARAGEF